MGVYICPRCDAVKESKDGDCIPALPESKNELVCEGCATDEELHAYLPGEYPDPDEGEVCGTCQGSGMSYYGPPDEGRCADCKGRGTLPSINETAANERAEAMREDDKMGER